jgi:hypothetical protein
LNQFLNAYLLNDLLTFFSFIYFPLSSYFNFNIKKTFIYLSGLNKN